MKTAYDGKHRQYFDKGIVSCDENKVLVDCGSTGDTTEKFIRQFGKYKRIYVYEPRQDNIQAYLDNLSKFGGVTVRHCGVGEKSDSLAMSGDFSASTFMAGTNAADSPETQSVSLDEDIQETITFLKMDIQGFEIPVLLGTKRYIRDDFPKLAICTCHVVSDMWEIPRLIDAIHPGYRFYIRHYSFSQNRETVLYAIPPKAKKMVPSGKKHRRIVTIDPIGGWDNSHLLKDCGVIPYLLHKNHHCDASMAGAKMGLDYSNQQYVKGLKLEFFGDDSLQTKIDYLGSVHIRASTIRAK